MERRQAIKTVLAATASTMLWTSCAESNVIEFLKDGKLLLNQRHQDYLGVISNSILPVKDVAKKLESPADFILRMINDCHSSEDISKFALGFDAYKVFMSEAQVNISEKDADQTIQLIRQKIAESEPSEDLIYFIEKVKNLSIQNLKTSAYYLTQMTDYQLIPEAFQACAKL